MRLTTKRNGKNVIPLLRAVYGIDLPYWRIDRADELLSYLSGDAVDKLAAYEDAEEQGLLVRLPCRVGDMVFSAFEDEDVFCGKVYAISTCDGTNWFSVRYDNGLRYDHTWDDFGRTVFLTRKEAETALQGEAKAVAPQPPKED